MSLRLEVVTPERSFLAADVNSVTVPGVMGEFGILPGHTPVLSLLKPGIVTFDDGVSVKQFMVAEGFVEVADDAVNIVCDVAKDRSEISALDEEDIQRELKNKMATLRVEDEEFQRLSHELEKSVVSLSLLK